MREAKKQPQIDEFKRAAEEASNDLAGEISKFKSDRDRLTAAEGLLKTDLENATKRGRHGRQAQRHHASCPGGEQEAQGHQPNDVGEAGAITSQKFDVPEGEIRRVNQRAGTVWIDLGRADSLQRQVTFGVFLADVTDVTVGSKKGSIEVTQVLGDPSRLKSRPM